MRPNTKQPPVIIIGMHRSGTTMVTDMLQRLGLYLGWVLQENAEALFFVERNEKLMNICGGDWEHPEPVLNLLQHSAMRQQASALLLRDLGSTRFRSYLGARRSSASKGSVGLDCPWGWKDPRNSFLLPLWMDLFPDARIVHIFRHPMDVARSLHVRESRAVERQLARLSGHPVNSSARANTVGVRREKGMLYLYRRMRAAQSRFSALRTYDRLRVPESLSLRKGFELWAAYAGKCVEHTDHYRTQSFSLRYEDFLAAPEDNLDKLRRFCGLDSDSVPIGDICGGIRADRRFAYRDDPEACQLFEEYRAHPLVKQLGYNEC